MTNIMFLVAMTETHKTTAEHIHDSYGERYHGKLSARVGPQDGRLLAGG